MTCPNEPIAVVGSACRFAGDSGSPSKLWQLLRQPRDVLKKIDRFGADGHYHVDGHHHGTSNVRHAYFLSQDPRAFDSQFFSISASEADAIDPQQRMLLETVYESIESAGLRLEDLQGSKTAVYAGTMTDDYAELLYHDPDAIPTYAATGSSRSILANRISYFFDWCGPSVSIDTACSSSLVAVHQAVQTLRKGESVMAVAAGSNLIFGPKMFIAESNLNMLSPTGRSRMWDASADGYARGEGIAAIVMKPLSVAIADGDHIEYLIRETGVNSDGRTPGITMPSSSAQVALIRDTYARAGLDLTRPSDSPQYFEAHGTGTKAGDPREAEAIYNSFFRNTENSGAGTLYVGSIKTVVGHTEGTAGLAGLLKAALAIQHEIIPPNLHFNNLNPDIEPFYGKIQIPTQAKAWPQLPAGVPRRASVNSFGFGGTNAHAIIESYQPDSENHVRGDAISLAPIVFSASSERSLGALLTSYLSFLTSNADIDMRALSWTLSRRSALPIRLSFPWVQSAAELRTKIEAKLDDKQSGPIGTRAMTKSRGILGIFTGQGAQWPAMGRDLITTSTIAAEVIDELEKSLAELPPEDRPTWSLKKELIASADKSRIAEGLLSQPLCTAVQVVLVDLLRQIDIRFDAVVGHSSGEIAAAYAAGFLTRRDAIRIAYYRGVCTKLARGLTGQPGRMLAVGISMDDAKDLCQFPHFKGRLVVAASNSSASVTLSGDADAVEEAKFILEDESKFARALKVDTAYHSHHMQPSSVPYITALKACNVEIQSPSTTAAKWFSSVLGGRVVDLNMTEDLQSVYWNNNMLKPVLFSQALQAALSDVVAPVIALEVGPHPALKGPASLTIEESLGKGIPYSGVLSRGNNDVEALSTALGFVWNHLGPAVVNFAGLDALFNEGAPLPTLLKSLPTYTWDHERKYWSESRRSRISRAREAPTHELLGVRSAEDVEGEYSWHTYLKTSELPWLRGHQIQGQLLFPGAGFVIMCLETTKALAAVEDVRLIEVVNSVIHRALSFHDEVAGVETLVKLTNVRTEVHGNEKSILADFSCSACLNKDIGNFTTMATSHVKIILGESSLLALPKRAPPLPHLSELDIDYFYKSLGELGYNYSDMFRGVTELRRAADVATGIINIPDTLSQPSECIVHPSTLDAAFQSVFGAVGVPGRLWSLHVPMKMDCLRINPLACPDRAGVGMDLPFDATVLGFTIAKGLYGDVDIYDETGCWPMMQLEGLHVAPVMSATKEHDRQVFAKTVWDTAEPDAENLDVKYHLNDTDVARLSLVERICFFYLKKLTREITEQERTTADEHRTNLLTWAANTIELMLQGKHPVCQNDWLNDTHANLQATITKLDNSSDLEPLIALGEGLVAFVRDEAPGGEQQLSAQAHAVYAGFSEYQNYLGQVVQQIAHRYPHMDILEVGAGGSASIAGPILSRLDNYYLSYTYANATGTGLEDVQFNFKDQASKLSTRSLDICSNPMEQEFMEQAYDLIIVTPQVLYSTQALGESLKNLRRIVKPGGYLALLEATRDNFQTKFICATASQFWTAAGEIDEFPLSEISWDSILKQNGFSGVDTSTPESTHQQVPLSFIVSQAIDTQISLLRRPLALTDASPTIENLLIVGGKTLATRRLVEEIQELLEPFSNNLVTVSTLDKLFEDIVPSRATVLSLAELDAPVFKPFTPEKLKGTQILLERSRNVLWVTKGCEGEQPFANMMIAIARCLLHEMDDLRLQSLDVGTSSKPTARLLAESLMRIQISGNWKSESEHDKQRMWTFERELSIMNDKVMIPRYTENGPANDRFNAFKRVVRKNVSLADTVVGVTPGEKYELHEYRSSSTGDEGTVIIDVHRSILTALKVTPVEYLHLIEGVNSQTQEMVIALSDHQWSRVQVPQNRVAPSKDIKGYDGRLLLAVANDLFASFILNNTAGGEEILIHEPPTVLAAALRRQAVEKHLRLTLTTTKEENSDDFRYLHPFVPDREIRSIIGKEVSMFVDLSNDDQLYSIGARVAKYLPTNCENKDVSKFFNAQTFKKAGALSGPKISDLFSKSYTRAIANLSDQDLDPSSKISLNDIPERSTKVKSLEIVNWKASSTASIRSRCAEDEVQFRGDRTYFLVGMTGELGLSLTEWMIGRGARYFALTSRSPKVNPEWIDLMKSKGALIKAFAMDVTSKASIVEVHKTICATMPQIAGVANAAMVIADGIFTNIPYETMKSSFAPKVDGSLYLDELFFGNDLDFFILFSSITSITGNVGQSSYAAANAFMTSLVKGRRQRGHVGSVMNLAGIMGIGYVTRAANDVLDRLVALGFSNISEWDFHQNFAEAVMAGPPDSGLDPELSAGLRVYDVNKDSNVPVWVQIPKFARYRRLRSQGGSDSDSGTRKSSVKAQLREQITEDGVRKVLLDGLLATLHDTLHMAEEDTISLDSAVVELGVDSLVAVDMRSWFSNELDLDMPVLKLLGGGTIADLVDDAASRLSEDLIPNVVSGSQPEKKPSSEERPSTPASGNASSDVSTDDAAQASISSEFTSTPEDPETGVASSQTSFEEEEDNTNFLPGTLMPKLTYQRTTRMGYGSTRFWFLRQYMQDPTTFNCISKFNLTGRIREADADRAVHVMGERHEGYRTAFFANADRMNEPTQGVLADSSLRLERKKINDESEVAVEYDALLNYNFDLEHGEAFRVVLLTLTPLKHFLIFCHHHIAMDGFSFTIFLAELNRLYSKQPVPPVTFQFTDFVERQRFEVGSGVMAKDLEFWRSQFTRFPESLPLFPVAKVNKRSPLTTYSFEEATEILDPATTAEIRDQARRHKSTTFHFLLAVLKVFLFRYLDVEDVCIGIADAGRGASDIVGTIGMLLNLLALQFSKGSDKQTFVEALTEARAQAFTAIGHSKLPFDVLLEELNVPRSSTYTPIFQVFMDYRQIAVKSPKMLGVKTDASFSPGRTAYDLVLDVRDIAGSEVIISFRMQEYLYSNEATSLLFKSYMRLVRFFAHNTTAEVNSAPLFDPVDTLAAAKLGRGPLMTSTWPETISHRIDNIARENVDALAIKDGLRNAFTYGAVTKRVDTISQALLNASVGQGSKVAAFQEPSADWVCTMLAIWKVGAVYVPLELTNALPRLASIVNDCKPKAVAYHDATASDIPALGAEPAKTINISDLADLATDLNIENKTNAEDAAAILYTSGSTGTPKGIVLRHSSIRNEIEGYSKQWSIGQEVVLQQSAYTFDFSLDQILSGLSNGGTVYVVAKSDRRDPVKIAQLIEMEKITYTKATPSEYSSWIQHGSVSLANAPQWRFAFGGGEPLTDIVKRQFQSLNNPSLQLLNSYGPGEITISCTKARIPYSHEDNYTKQPIPLGSPLPNYALYVIDRNLQLVPQGVTGEIVIGGLGPAVGYLNNDELTKKKFLPDTYTPIQVRTAEGWTTVYRSGDLGRLQPDGSMLFEGRIEGDSQVKLRGIRIELEDIESTIIRTAKGAVTKAVASVRGDPQFIVAHVEFADTFSSDPDHRSRFAKELIGPLPLPHYMRPAMIVAVDAIPLNNHSKVDRLTVKQLPLPTSSTTSPRAKLTLMESALRDVWLSVISRDVADVVGVDGDSDFFHLGGSSLLLVKLQAQIRDTFDAVIPLAKLFDSSTLHSMAACIQATTIIEEVNWDEETALQDNIVSVPVAKEQERVNDGITVLLTGATGYLGGNILRKLIEDERVARIHCVAVRQQEAQARKVSDSPKIVSHPGDLTESLLGLSPNAFSRLSNEVDIIVHSGASRSFWDYYQLLRGVNVTATKEVVRLANQRKIPVHFLSSGGVLGFANTGDASSVSQFPPPADGSAGYVSSKWVSEVYLEKAAAELNIPIHIHRVTPPEDSTHQPSIELLDEFCNMATRMRTLPLEAGWNGSFDLVAVRPLAGEIVDAALSSIESSTTATTPTEAQFVHHASEVTLEMEDVRKHMEEKVSGPQLRSFERLPPHKWVGQAKTLGIGYHFASQDLTLGAAAASQLSLRR